MGCGSSQPVAQEHEVQEVVVKKVEVKQGASTQQPSNGASKASASATVTAAEAERAKTTRARRLSYVSADANGVASADPTAVPAVAATKPISPPAAPTVSNTGRARRLSYIDASGKQVDAEQDPDPDNAILGTDGLAALDDEDTQGRTIRVNVACMSRAGREPGFKKTNQDNCFAFEKYITEDQSLFGAMDGHGPHGHLVSGYVKQHLPIIMVNHLTTEKDVKRALTSGFVEVDKSLGISRIDCEFSGSTCVVSYLKGRTLTTAWVGDSRGVMGREAPDGRIVAMDLTADHKPTTPEEKNRILRSNGRVERLVDETGQPMGPFRVWLQYAWIPGLAMSRALGDVLAHQVGVVSEPEHSVHELCSEDRFIILASDGVWEFISSQEAVDIIAQYDTAEEACRQLVDEAYQRWLTEEEGVVDDITAVVVKFVHPT
ncbi:phosphatase 2C-like protein [Haematococcus lacustris]